jgi:hypothetical protein
MKRWVPVWSILLVASCSPPAPEPTAIQRGALIFAPVTEALGSGMAADLAKSNPSGFALYLKEIGGKDASDLAKKISREVLLQYAEALSVSSTKEAELKAGKIDEVYNARTAKQLLAAHDADDKESLTPVGKVVAEKVRSSEWKDGLPLEFAVRVLRDELPKKTKPKKLPK